MVLGLIFAPPRGSMGLMCCSLFSIPRRYAQVSLSPGKRLLWALYRRWDSPSVESTVLGERFGATVQWPRHYFRPLYLRELSNSLCEISPQSVSEINGIIRDPKNMSRFANCIAPWPDSRQADTPLPSEFEAGFQPTSSVIPAKCGE